MIKKDGKARMSEYRFLELFVSTMVIEKKGMIIEKSKLERNLLKVYDNEDLHFLFEDICKKGSFDNSYVDLSEAFQTAQTFGLLTVIHDTSKDIKYVINVSEKDAHGIASNFNGNEMLAMIELIKQINTKTDYETLVESQTNYLLYLKKLAEDNPEEAKKIATESLIRSGIIDTNGKLKPPYNGENVNPDDFTRGPRLTKKMNN